MGGQQVLCRIYNRAAYAKCLQGGVDRTRLRQRRVDHQVRPGFESRPGESLLGGRVSPAHRTGIAFREEGFDKQIVVRALRVRAVFLEQLKEFGETMERMAAISGDIAAA